MSKEKSQLRRAIDDAAKKEHKVVDYLVIQTGYTSRIADRLGMQLLIKSDKKDFGDSKVIQSKINDYLVTAREAKSNSIFDVVVEEKKKEACVKEMFESCTPLIIIDDLWGQGIYVNPKAKKKDLVWILENLGYQYGVVVFTNVTHMHAVTGGLQALDYCTGWDIYEDPVKTEYADGTHVEYRFFDCESG
jgi:hypothetical protein